MAPFSDKTLFEEIANKVFLNIFIKMKKKELGTCIDGIKDSINSYLYWRI